MTKIKFAAMTIVAIVLVSVLSVATVYCYANNVQEDEVIISSTNHPVKMNTITTIDDSENGKIMPLSDAVACTKNVITQKTVIIDNASCANTTYDDTPCNTITSTTCTPTTTYNAPVNTCNQNNTVTSTDYMIPTTGINSNCTTGNCTNMDNSDFKCPTYEQLVNFLTNDHTDLEALPDNQAAEKLAKSATENKLHNQIVILVFGNEQTFSVNRFPLSDGTYAYIDCSKPSGFTGNDATIMDRIINVHRNMPITGKSLSSNVAYSYPLAVVEYGIPMWSI
jgi:hypothetical protein